MKFEIEKIYEESKTIVIKDVESGRDVFTLKPFGCIEYDELSEAHGEVFQSMHICDIDLLIAKLQEIKRLGAEHFNNEYWIK